MAKVLTEDWVDYPRVSELRKDFGRRGILMFVGFCVSRRI